MKKIVTFAVVTGGALALAACGGTQGDAPAAEPTEAEMMAPATDDAAAAAAADLDPTANPIRPAEGVTEADAAPAAE